MRDPSHIYNDFTIQNTCIVLPTRWVGHGTNYVIRSHKLNYKIGMKYFCVLFERECYQFVENRIPVFALKLLIIMTWTFYY